MSARAAFLMALALAGAAAAQSPAPAPGSIAGAWRFETGTFYGSCRLVGAMMIIPAAQPNRFTCRFTAYQKCAGLADDVAEQVCAVTRAGDVITISSRLVRVTAPGYAADQWRLKIKSPTLMIGHQWDSHSPRLPNGAIETLPATFTRAPTPIS